MATTKTTTQKETKETVIKEKQVKKPDITTKEESKLGFIISLVIKRD